MTPPTLRTTSLRVEYPARAGTAVPVRGVSLWVHVPAVHHGPTPADVSNFEDLDIVAASDNSQDNVEMLQDDLDFYAWAEKTQGGEPAA